LKKEANKNRVIDGHEMVRRNIFCTADGVFSGKHTRKKMEL